MHNKMNCAQQPHTTRHFSPDQLSSRAGFAGKRLLHESAPTEFVIDKLNEAEV